MTEQDELRDKIVEWLSNETTLLEVECEAAGDALIALIDGQRCEWTLTEEGLWKTQCGQEIPDEDTYEKYPFCPCCGKRISIGEDKNV